MKLDVTLFCVYSGGAHDYFFQVKAVQNAFFLRNYCVPFLNDGVSVLLWHSGLRI